jgi:hypothetical protein
MRKELQEALIKKASAKGEIGSMFAWNLVPWLGIPGNAIGSSAGSVDQAATKEEEEAWDKKPSYALGRGAYRSNRRQKRQLLNDKGTTPHYFSQGFGTGTALLASILAGAGAGSAIGAGLGATSGSARKALALAGVGASTGAGFGGGIGLLATLAAPGLALLTKRRTKEQQKAYANSPTTAEYLVPGLGVYNMWKTVGRSIGDSEERIKKNNEEA